MDDQAPTIQGPTYMYKSAGTFATVLTVLFFLNIMVCVMAIGSSWLEIDLLREYAAGAEVTVAQATANDLRQGVIGLGQLGLFVLLVVGFCMWIYRANCNTRALGAESLSISPGWSVGWFFIPIMNLFKPYQAVKEIWVASHSSPATSVAIEDAETPPAQGAPLVSCWWSFWILANIFANVGTRLALRADTAEQAIAGSFVGIAATGLEVVAAALAIMVIRGIHEQHERRDLEPREMPSDEIPGVGIPGFGARAA